MLDLAERLVFWLAFGIVSLDAYFVLFHKGIPNIRTAPAIRRQVISLLQQDFAAKGHPPSYIIMDLGSGNGLLTREIAKAIPGAKVVGLEIAPQSLAWANWMKKRQGLANLDYRQQDFLTCDYSEADAVVMFLIPAVLGALGKKLHESARPGTLIISNKFPLGDGWQPTEKQRVKTLYLHQGGLYIYRGE
jgi:SAM-dependent methyltransferase